jgi:hypothetical protein
MNKIAFMFLIVFGFSVFNATQVWSGCNIVWSGDSSGSLPTTETSKTEQAAEELFEAIRWDYSPNFCPQTAPIRDWYGTCYSNGCFYSMCGTTPTLKQDVCLDGSWAEYTAQLFTCNLGKIGSGFWDVICETVIELSSMKAVLANGNVMIQWSTESEIDNAGFNIYRSKSEDGEYLKINDALMPAKGTPTKGASDEYTDYGLRNGRTYYYKLEDVDLNGVSTMHEVVKATPRWIYSFFK